MHPSRHPSNKRTSKPAGKNTGKHAKSKGMGIVAALSALLSSRALPLLLLLGLGAMSFVLVTSAISLGAIYNLTPCQFCYWQRYPHFVIITLATIGGVAHAIASSKTIHINIRPCISHLLTLAIIAMLVASGLGFWHVAIEIGWVVWLGECASPPILIGDIDAVLDSLLDTKPTRCDTPQWYLFGISMAGWNAGISLLAALTAIAVAIYHRQRKTN